MEAKTIADLFGHISKKHDVAPCPVRAIDNTLPAGAYPKRIDHYYFNPRLFTKMLRVFLSTPPNPNTLLMGDTGAGKSSLVEQMATRLGWPVFSIACSGKLRISHLVGSFELRSGETVWRDGPLTRAMRSGGVFLADEITRMDHSEQMALAKVLDSGTITIPETGEIVCADPRFRFFATGNSGGFGDDSGAYNGERVASIAFVDRMQKFKVDYPPEEAEIELLQRVTGGDLQASVAKAMVHLANDVRRGFIGRGGDLRVILSTRCLTVWARESLNYQRSGLFAKPVDEALEDSFLNGAPEEDVSTIKELWLKWINESLSEDTDLGATANTASVTQAA